MSVKSKPNQANAALSTRVQQLAATALDLFLLNGFSNTGIDKILHTSGVAKMTLYKHFRSKCDLIISILQQRDEEFFEWFQLETSKTANPKQRLLALFDVRDELIQRPDFSGCIFIRAAAEFPQLDHPVHKTAAQTKLRMYEYIVSLCEDAGASDPKELAHQLLLLIEGATVLAHVTGWRTTAKSARAAAVVLLKDIPDAAPAAAREPAPTNKPRKRNGRKA
jgi:AcrR family transcriptional regulator